MKKEIKDKPISIKTKLLNLSRIQRIDFDALLLRFMQERFLHRLILSEFSGNFILKGGLLLACFNTPLSRPTKDIDFLGKGIGNTDKELENAFKTIAELPNDDGVEFIPSSISLERIIEDQLYEGIRIRLDAKLGKAVKRLQMDIGFGDLVWPKPEFMEFPTIFDENRFSINAYTVESVIAEKFEIMLKLGMINSRMKDFFDIYSICKAFDFNGINLKNAIYATLQQRGTIMTEMPIIFRQEFCNSLDKGRQWDAFLRKTKMDKIDRKFNNIMQQISYFLKPIISSIIERREVAMHWRSGRGIWES